MIPGAALGPARTGAGPGYGWHPAARLGILLLGWASILLLHWPAAAAVLALVVAGLVRAGWSGRDLLRAGRPWWPVAALVLAVHAVTATAAAPLGRPSWAGLMAGLLALTRVAAAMTWLGLFIRTTELDDLVTAVQWWLRPLARLGVPAADLGLVLAVAMGTVPLALSEGRRMAAVTRLRRHAPPGFCPSRPARRTPWVLIRDRAEAVVPLLESLARRSDAVALSLRPRRPQPGVGGPPPPVGQALLLIGWTAVVLWLAFDARIDARIGGAR